MRSTTGPELTLLGSDIRRVERRVQVQNGSGTWKTLTNLSGTGFSGLDFVESLQWSTDIDAPTWNGSVVLAPHLNISSDTAISISPYVEDSPANVDDADAYSPLIEGMRRIRWYTTVSNYDSSVSTEHKVFDGYVVEVEHQDGLSLSVSDLGHRLVIAQIEEERIYTAGQLLETAIQAILDNTLGVEAPTLVVDPSIAGLVMLSSDFRVERTKLMEAIRNLAFLTVGANVRYMWNNSDEMELRLFMPPRSKTVADFTYDRDTMYANPTFREKTDDVRNAGMIRYRDAEKKSVADVRLQVDESIAKYKRRYFEFVEAATSQINTRPEAVEFLTAAINDLATPKAEQQHEAPYNWAADAWDLYTLEGNGYQYTADQDMGVTRVAHAIERGVAQSTFDTRGTIAGFVKRWIAVEGKGPVPENDNSLTVAIGMAGEASMYGGELFNGKPDGCVWPFLFLGKNIKKVHGWARNNAAGTAVLKWPPVASDIYKAFTLQRPEGKIPREGNFTFGPGPFEGRTVWRSYLPIPTTPGIIRTVIIKAETHDGTFGPEQRLTATADDTGGTDPGGFSALTITRPDATTVTIVWTPVGSTGATVLMRDGIVIDVIIDDGDEKTWLDEELHADKQYEYSVFRFLNGHSGERTIEVVDAWTTSLAFDNDTPVFDDSAGPHRVRIEWTGAPVGTETIRIRRSVDSGHYDPWMTIAEVPVGDANFMDAVVVASQYYQLQALDEDDEILDTSQPAFWVNALS